MQQLLQNLLTRSTKKNFEMCTLKYQLGGGGGIFILVYFYLYSWCFKLRKSQQTFATKTIKCVIKECLKARENVCNLRGGINLSLAQKVKTYRYVYQ
jgi:hypothetical protein